MLEGTRRFLLQSHHRGPALFIWTNFRCSKFQEWRSPPPQTQHLNDRCPYQWTLSEDQSPDWYEAEAKGSPGPPFAFDIELVQTGPQTTAGLGWTWGFHKYIGDDSPFDFDSCEINWLDPGPDRNSNDYEIYIQELQAIQGGNDFFSLQLFTSSISDQLFRRVLPASHGSRVWTIVQGTPCRLMSLGHAHRYMYKEPVAVAVCVGIHILLTKSHEDEEKSILVPLSLTTNTRGYFRLQNAGNRVPSPPTISTAKA